MFFMKRFFTFFEFNRIEQRGFIGFTVLIFCILLIPILIKTAFYNKEKIEYDVVYLENNNLERADDNSRIVDNQRNSSYKIKRNQNRNNEIVLFDFDPNNLDEELWLKLGLSKKQVAVIKNYESKGGRFYKKEDLSKIYVISDQDYKKLEPYIKISNIETKARRKDSSSLSTYSSKQNIQLDINRADTNEWKLLPGIGSVFANRIVKYRELLGGFYKIDQLMEVYNLPLDTYERIKENVYVDSTYIIEKIKINSCSFGVLAKHSYVSNKQANTIINYRNQHGEFENLESLSRIKSLDSIFLCKIAPYLEF